MVEQEAIREVIKVNTVGKLPTAEQEGEQLKEWYTDPTGGTAVTANTIVRDDVTYYVVGNWNLI